MPDIDRWLAERVSVERGGHAFIDARQIKLEWQPITLFRRELMIETLSVDSLMYSETSDAQATSLEQNSTPKNLSILLSAIQLKTFTLGRLIAPSLRLDKPHEQAPDYAITGGASWQDEFGFLLDLNAKTLNEIPAAFTMTVQSNDWQSVAVTGSLHEATNRFFSKLLQLPIEQEVVASIDSLISLNERRFDAQLSLQKTLELVTIKNAFVTTMGAEVRVNGEVRVSGGVQTDSMHAMLNLKAKAMPVILIEMAGIPLPDTLLGTINANLILKGDIAKPIIEGATTLQGNYEDIPFTISAAGRYEDKNAQFEQLILHTFGEEVFVASGRYQPPQFDARFRAEKLPSKLFAKLSTKLGWETQSGLLSTQLNASGTLENPNINGSFLYQDVLTGFDEQGEEKPITFSWELKANTIDSSLNIASTFKLEQGQVTFANNAIAMSIPAVYQKNGQQITAKIIVSNDNFNLSLSAIPTMPEDEILAFIIFGKPLQKITPFEAIQLATAVQTLRSDGGGFFDPIGKTRKFLGVDTLSIGSETNSDGATGVNLGVGKYLNEKDYLEIQRTANPSQSWKGKETLKLN
jgi:autotransporter translocation and assembly factor TamB